MKFINTDKLSPIINYGDLPWKEDYFHLRPEEVTKEFKESGFYDIDVDWWHKQKSRCLNGYQIENGIDFGGDVYRDEKEAFWNDSKIFDRYVKDIEYTIPPNSCYIPMYDLLIEDKKLKITGRHYYYLNFSKIYALDNSMKERVEKDIEQVDIKGQNSPIFTDVDWGFFVRVMNMFKFKKDTSEAKGRQFGYSHKGGIAIAAYNFSFIRSSQTIIAGGMSDDADKTFSIARSHLKTQCNTQFFKQLKRGGDSDNYLEAQNFMSTLYSISCKDNTQALSRLTPYVTILEECGKWKQGFVNDVIEFNKAAQMAQGRKTGYNILIGTGGDMTMGAADLQEIHYSPEDNGILSYKNIWEKEEDIAEKSGHFTPGWQFKVIDKDGNSNREAGIQFLKDELAKRKTVTKRYIFTTQNPIYASDAFAMSSGGFFGENIVRMANERKAYLMIHRLDKKPKVGRLEWKDPKNKLLGCNFFNDENGPITIFEEPSVDTNGKVWEGLYKAGTDSYDYDEARTSSSKGDIRVFKTFLNTNESSQKFVAKCTDRPATAQGGAEVWFENNAKLSVYYNVKNLMEWSKILIFKWYEQHNLEQFLKERPGFIISSHINKSQTVNRYGADAAVLIHALTLYRKWLEVPQHIEDIDDVEQLTAIVNFKLDPKYNCDTTVACAWAITCAKDEDEILVRGSSDQKDDEKLRKFKRVGDKLVQVFD